MDLLPGSPQPETCFRVSARNAIELTELYDIVTFDYAHVNFLCFNLTETRVPDTDTPDAA